LKQNASSMKKYSSQSKNNTKEQAMISAGKVIRLYSDPAVKVLREYILSDYHDGEVDDLFGIYEGFVVLIEKDGYSAREVIENTALLVRNVEPFVNFSWTDLTAASMVDLDQILLGHVYNLIGQFEDDPLQICVFDHLAAYLKLAVEGKAKNHKRIFEELKNLNSIFIIPEADLPLFSETLDRDNFAIKIWLCRQPDRLDIVHLNQPSPETWGHRATVNEAIYTEDAKLLITKARQIAELWGDMAIDAHSLLLAAAEGSETGLAVTQCLNLSLETLRHLRADREWKLIRAGEISSYPFDPDGIEIIETAMKLASVEGYPDRTYPGLITSYHLVCSIAMSHRVRTDLEIKRKFSFVSAIDKLAEWYHNKYISPSIDRKSTIYSFIFPYQGLQRELMGYFFGQNDALEKTFEYFCNDDIKALKRNNENLPPLSLLFYGPPGVGKAHLGGLLARHLDRPVLHLDLAIFESVVPRPLNKFVQANWKAVLILENIDQAEPQVLKLICQILDQGAVYDQKMATEIDYSETILIMTTALNKELLDFLPGEITARMNSGQMVPFKELNAAALINICKRKFTEYASVVEKACEKTFTYDPLIPYCLLFAEGGEPAPHELAGAVERLVGIQVQKFTNCFTPNSGEHLLTDFSKIHFAVEGVTEASSEVQELFNPARSPQVLLLAEENIAAHLKNVAGNIRWKAVQSIAELNETAENGYYDFALLDLWSNITEPAEKINLINNFATNRSLNVTRLPMPALLRQIFGDLYLRETRRLKEKMPVVMLNVIDPLWLKYAHDESELSLTIYLDLADELRKMRDEGIAFSPLEYGNFWSDYFFQLLCAAGARGLVHLSLDQNQSVASFDGLNPLMVCLNQLWGRLYCEKMAGVLAGHHQRLLYNPVWKLDHEGKMVIINLEDLQLVEA
jgi:DNA polymerase III delta prime subunit